MRFVTANGKHGISELYEHLPRNSFPLMRMPHTQHRLTQGNGVRIEFEDVTIFESHKFKCTSHTAERASENETPGELCHLIGPNVGLFCHFFHPKNGNVCTGFNRN